MRTIQSSRGNARASTKILTNVDDGERIGALQERVRAVLQDYERNESDVPLEVTEKKKHNLF